MYRANGHYVRGSLRGIIAADCCTDEYRAKMHIGTLYYRGGSLDRNVTRKAWLTTCRW